MKALLMHRDRDFTAPEEALRPHWRRDRNAPRPEPPPLERDLVQDLELGTIVAAMARDDEFLAAIARAALLAGLHGDMDTILYRQQALRDCLRHPQLIRELYDLAVETMETKDRSILSVLGRTPSGVLFRSIESLQLLSAMLRRLRGIAEAHGGEVESEGFRSLFAMLRRELDAPYLAEIQDHLAWLRFREGILMSAHLGDGNQGTNVVLRQRQDKKLSWFDRLRGKRPPGLTFVIADRDEAGHRALSAVCDLGINSVANALAQSADHVESLFVALRAELGFYVGCLNLHERLSSLGVPLAFPEPRPAGARELRVRGLCDPTLALAMGRRVVGNALEADGKNLVVITGANQGGKSSFLRALGVAQVMMQAGMIVAADGFAGELAAGVFTHAKREEDPTMQGGKLDEELARIGAIADAIGPEAMLFLNESFASTNEREGSEIARQIVAALREKRIKVFFVTHLYEFARGLLEGGEDGVLFLRAERLADGTRSFKLAEAEPLETSFGADLYREVLESPRDCVAPTATPHADAEHRAPKTEHDDHGERV